MKECVVCDDGDAKQDNKKGHNGININTRVNIELVNKTERA